MTRGRRIFNVPLDFSRCQAIVKSTGKRCLKGRLPRSKFCHLHQEKP
jgi:hypothetical protein